MDVEPETLDPHEVKVLADILALVLEDQGPEATVALETVRRKARQHRVTGGVQERGDRRTDGAGTDNCNIHDDP